MTRPDLGIASVQPQHADEARADVEARQAARLLHVSAVSVFVTDRGKTGLRCAAASDPSARELDELQTKFEAGPAYAAFRDCEVHSTVTDGGLDARWPTFARALNGSAFAGASAVPATRDGRPIGVVMLYQRRAVALSPTSRHYALARLLASALVAATVREEAMRDLRETIAELGALLDRVNRLVRDGDVGAD